MATLYSRVYTHFNTNWDTGVIAKPTFFDMTLQNYRPANSLGILTNQPAGWQNQMVADNNEYGRGWTFQLFLYAETDANLELMIEQSIKLINSYNTTNQRWIIDSYPDFSSTYGLKGNQILCHETSIVEAISF